MHHRLLNVPIVALASTLASVAGAQPRTTTAARLAPTLPSVVGLSVDSARRALVEFGARVPITVRDSSTNAAPADRVLRQEPRARTPLSSVKAIILVVAAPVGKLPPRSGIPARVAGGRIIPPRRDPSSQPVPPPGPRPITVVPNLFGQGRTNTIALLERARLRLQTPVTGERSDLADSGFVFQQHPPADSKADTGSMVKVWVSLGPHPLPRTIRTPNVVGESLDRARRILRDASLTVGHVDTVVQPNARGEVQHQLPEPDAPTHPKEKVALRIAIPRAGVPGTYIDVDENQPMVRRRTAVPYLLGMTRAEAASRLARDTLLLGHVVVADAGAAAVVVSQIPEAGDSVFLYDGVSVTLDSPILEPQPERPRSEGQPSQGADRDEGPAPPQRPPADTSTTLVRVPDVRDLSADSARKVLAHHGVIAVATSIGEGTSFVVASQDPDPGTLVPMRAEVTLALEQVSSTRPVPNLVGLRRAAAAAHASGDGFALSVQSSRRVFLQLFERVALQEADTLTIRRGDQVIHVDLAIPLIPPLPAGIVLVLVAAGITVWKPKPERVPQAQPLPGLDIQFNLPPPSPPALARTPDDRVIRSAITFTLDAGAGEWRLESGAPSLIAQVDTHV